jgi:flagellar hook-associated protein FlgK
MSDSRVRAAIEQMEGWLSEPNWEPDPAVLERWNTTFQAALAGAGRSEGWSDLVAKAHEVARHLETRMNTLVQLQNEVRAELGTQERGNRALRGYRTIAR